MLVFLPGEAEIRDAADAVRGMYAKDAAPTEVLPLYGRLSAAEQHRVFERSQVAGIRRRVILATNVAETSLTVPGIRYVVDTGTARISRYSNRSKVQRLPIEAVSQASAQQRSGRAGRTSDGIAIRLYSEEDFDSRPEFTEPEILRTSLASVILQMLSLGFGDISSFPFLTPPDSRGVKAAFDLLVELGAVRLDGSSGRAGSSSGDDRGHPTLTDLGREIARLPIDPRFARMLVEARRTGVLRDVLAIVAGLSIQDVRERPEDRREEADRLHARFTDPTSDFVSLLNLWNHLQEKQAELGSSAFRRLCRAEHLNYVRVREWADVHRQLSTLVNAPRKTSPGAADADEIHKAILSGLLSQLGILDERTTGSAARGRSSDRADRADQRRGAEYLGSRGTRFAIFPGSGLKKKRPSAVMAAEVVETSRLFARTVAAIDPEWAEPLAGDLAKRSLSEPHWSKASGAASAYEKVTLFGLEIVPKRRVQLARFDRPFARELFLRHALVEGDWDSTHLDKRLTAFERRNLELRRRLEKVEERERRRDILVGDEAVYRFYDARIPRDVFDARSFEAWWREASVRTPRLLDMTEADLVDEASRGDERDFPARWTQGDQVLSLAYRFEPGAADDGVTAVVPLALLAQLRPDGFDWQVPGMRDELITALLRSLPKSIRRHVVPAADWAATFSADLAGQGPEAHDGLPPTGLREALAARIQRVASQPVSAADFEMERVPGHLQVSFRAVDERGRAVGSDRDLTALQARLADRARASVSRSLSAPGAGVRAGGRHAGTAIGERARCGGAARVDVRRAHRPDRLDVRRPPRGRRHEGGRRRRARLPRPRRRERLGGRPHRDHPRGGGPRHAGGRAPARAAVGRLPHGVCARAPDVRREARARGIPVSVGEGADRGLPCGGGGCRHHAHGGDRAGAHPRGLRGGAGRVLGRRRGRALPDRVARRADPHGVAGGREGDARRQFADAARRPQRRQGPARGSGVSRASCRAPAPRASRTFRATCAARSTACARSPTIRAATGSG